MASSSLELKIEVGNLVVEVVVRVLLRDLLGGPNISLSMPHWYGS